MLRFRQKFNIVNSDILSYITDCHSHILPGVDDGIQTMEEAVETLERYEQLGIRKVHVTPHIMEEYPQNTSESLKQRFDELIERYHGKITLSLGAEYMLDAGFEHHLNNRRLLTAYDKYVMLETSCLSKPIYFENVLSKIKSKGFNIILAHPERYNYMQISDYEFLKNERIFFQLNILSLIGSYGESVGLKARKLLQNDFYDCVGTDLHNFNFHYREFNRKKLYSEDILRLNMLVAKSDTLFSNS